MRTIMLSIGLIFAIGTTGVALAETSAKGKKAGSLPPVGKRIYVIDDNKPNAPVVIKDGKAQERKVYLRDPVSPASGKKASVKTVKIRKKSRTKARVGTKGRYQPVKLRFGKLPVVGRLSAPRVVFSRETLDIGRLDEPTQPDFFERVFEPAADENF